MTPGPDRIGVSVRDVEKAQHLADRGVRVRRGSYDDPGALRDSFEGAEQVLLVSSNDPGAGAPVLHRVGIEAAVEAGARRILWTSLRNGFYAHSLDWMLGPWRETGIIAAPADGPISWTDRGDEGEAAAVILATPRSFDGLVTLTAAAAVTFDDIAGIISELTGRDIQRAVMDDDPRVADQVAHGAPEMMARFMLSTFQAAREGRFAAPARCSATSSAARRARFATCSPTGRRPRPRRPWLPSGGGRGWCRRGR
jgi:NAD(P)H dehydrogenase (quinone)